jgi:hypothetical protein
MNGAAWRAVLALVLLTALGAVAQARLIAHLLAPWRTVIETLEPDFRVVDLQSKASGVEPLIEVTVAPARVIVVGGRAVAADASAHAQASTPRGGVWLLMSVFVATLLAWPVRQPRREWLLRAAIGTPLLAALLLLDIPIALLGPLREVIVDHLAPGAFDLWIVGSHFLRSGGRALLGIAGAALVCLLAQAALHRKKSS